MKLNVRMKLKPYQYVYVYILGDYRAVFKYED